MKREKRTLLNQLRKSVTTSTINVEIPVSYTHEERQALHELLTIEKGMCALCIYWNDILGEYCVHYEPIEMDSTATATKRDQETRDIDEVTAELPRRDYTWNGYHKPTEPTTGTETATEPNENEKEETPMFPNLTATVNAHFDENAAKFAATPSKKPLPAALSSERETAVSTSTKCREFERRSNHERIDHPLQGIPRTPAHGRRNRRRNGRFERAHSRRLADAIDNREKQ